MKKILYKHWKLCVVFIFLVSLILVLFIFTKATYANAETLTELQTEQTRESIEGTAIEEKEQFPFDDEIETQLNQSSDLSQERKLSELTEEELLEFLFENNIEIPVEFEYNQDLYDFIENTILLVENNPDYEFTYNYFVTLKFAEDIKAAVNNYYNLRISEPIKLFSTTSYTLQDSVLWSNSGNLNYNCYAYAIGKNENPPEYETDRQYQPGNFSGKTFDLSVNSIANVVKADLEYLGYVDVIILTQQPTIDSNSKLICVRTGKYDYHFMKYESNSWYHKPGFYAILKYNYQTHDKIWTSEYVDAGGVAYEGNYTYDSEVLYITYKDAILNKGDEANLFGGGYGTYAFPYLISNVNHFENIRVTATKNYYYELTNRISYPSNSKWTPIPEFKGVLDGKDYYISQLEIDSSAGGNLGLFKINSGKIKNLKLNFSFSVGSDKSNVNVGSFAGINRGTIVNCSVGAVYIRPFFRCYAKGDSYMGCFVGVNEGTIENCIGGDWLNGSCNMGTIAGKNSGIITECSAGNGIHKILIDYEDYNACVGGIAGVQTSGQIINCSFQGIVELQNYYSNKYDSILEDREIQICAGILVGYKKGGTVSKNKWMMPNDVIGYDMVRSMYELREVTWTTGALWWKKTHTHNQGLYFRNEVYGREDFV